MSQTRVTVFRRRAAAVLAVVAVLSTAALSSSSAARPTGVSEQADVASRAVVEQHASRSYARSVVSDAEQALLDQQHKAHSLREFREKQAADKAAAIAKAKRLAELRKQRHKAQMRKASKKAASSHKQAPPSKPRAKKSTPLPSAPKSCSAYSGNRNIGCTLVLKRGWSLRQMACLNKLWNKESGWRKRARNPSSGAYGIPQALPGRKMASAGSDWRTNAVTQIRWGLGYINGRYGTPCNAWGHSQRTGWY